MNRLFRWLLSLDWVLILVPALLVTFGLVMIFTLGQAQNRPDLFWSQLIYAGAAVVVFVVVTLVDPRFWRSTTWLGYVTGLILLGLVLVVGRAQFGAQRWIDLGAFQLQPAELMKAIGIFTIAHLLADRTGRVGWRSYFAVLIVATVPVLLILAQPDLGSAIVLIAVAGMMLLASRLSARELLVGVVVVVVGLGAGWLSLRDYQRVRIETFLNHSDEGASGADYNVAQSIIAVGSGGLTGTGIGRGSQSRLNFLPVAHTDFVFATIAEATGLVGAGTLLLLYLLLIWRIWRLARIARDSFTMLVAVGVGAMFFVQVAVNMGMNIGLLPVTGIPLPLVSHGGSSLLVTVFLLAVLESQSRRQATQRLST